MNETKRRGDWIRTYTGRKFWPLDPRPEDIDIADIAHALSLQCRFTGHCRHFYSVAEHSIHVASLVPEEHALWALLHDASEAYLVDVARPVKRDPIMAPYRDAEAAIMRCVCEQFGLPVEEPEDVRIADKIMLGVEARTLMGVLPGEGWDPWLMLARPYNFELYPAGTDPELIEADFLRLIRAAVPAAGVF